MIFLNEQLSETGEMVAAFKQTSNGETLSKQHGMQTDVEAYTKVNKNATSQIRRNPNFRIDSKRQRKVRLKFNNSKSNALVEALRRHVERYNLVNSLSQASVRIASVQIARVDVDSVNEDLRKCYQAGRSDRW